MFEENVRPESPISADERPPADDTGRRGVIWYLRQAIQIARCDHTAIARVAEDRRALWHGAWIVAVAAIAAHIGGVTQLPANPDTEAQVPPVSPVVALAVGIPLQLVASALNIAIIHGLARLLFGVSGRYRSLLQVLWLGAIVQWLAVIPAVGILVAAIWMLLITLVTFEEVDGIERLQALMLVFAFGILSLLFNALLAY